MLAVVRRNPLRASATIYWRIAYIRKAVLQWQTKRGPTSFWAAHLAVFYPHTPLQP